MKKARLITLIAFFIMLTAIVLTGCNKEENVVSVALKDHDPSVAIELEGGNFDYGAYTVVVTYESGRTEEIALAQEMLSAAEQAKLYRAGDHDVSFTYGKAAASFKVSIKRSTFKSLHFPEDTVFTYDGEAHKVEVDGDIPQNAVITYPSGNSFTNAGTYDVVAIVSCDGYVTQKLSTTVKIERARYDMSGVKLEAKEVVYDGASHSVAISGTLPKGVSSPTYTINGQAGSSATDVGEYTVKATFTSRDPNYEAIPEMEATLKITPAEYIVKGVDIVFKSENGNVLSDATKIYDGKSITFDLNDYDKLSKKISVSFSVYDQDGTVISTSNKKTNVIETGVYTVKIEFTMANGKNYKPIAPIVRTFEVLKAEYPPLENIEFSPIQTTYDGEGHSIVIEGELPVGVTVSYEYYKDDVLLVDGEGNPLQAVVDAGRYIVKAVFTHMDENRNEIEPASAVLNIAPQPVDASNLLIGLEGTDVYDGTEKAVVVSGELPDEIEIVLAYYLNGTVLVNPDGSYVSSLIDPGEYTVLVFLVSTSDNYVTQAIIEHTVTIKRAPINTDAIIFNGADEYTYNGNAQGPSINSGSVPETVEVTEALFSIDVGGNRTAVSAAVNAGDYVRVYTVTPKDPERYQVLGSGVIELEFEIARQEIDTSDIGIASEKVTYNGSDLTPVLAGVPETVVIDATLYALGGLEPIGQAINAGQYRLEVALSPKNANYVISSTDVLVFNFEILPMEIDVSGLSFDCLSFVYDGTMHQPALEGLPENVIATTRLYWGDDINNNLSEYEGKLLGTSIGEYGCRITLKPENSNYVLRGTDTYNTKFRVTPIVIDVTEIVEREIVLVYTAEGYKDEDILPLVVDGIGYAVVCSGMGRYYKIDENGGETLHGGYLTGIEVGRYMSKSVKLDAADNNYILRYNGEQKYTLFVNIYLVIVPADQA